MSPLISAPPCLKKVRDLRVGSRGVEGTSAEKSGPLGNSTQKTKDPTLLDNNRIKNPNWESLVTTSKIIDGDIEWALHVDTVCQISPGKWKKMRFLIDTGAYDNFLHPDRVPLSLTYALEERRLVAGVHGENLEGGHLAQIWVCNFWPRKKVFAP